MRIVNNRQLKYVRLFLAALGMNNDDIEGLSPQFIIETALRKTDKEPASIEKLIDYLATKTDFYTAPASTRFHGNYDGALAEHSINVASLLYAKNKDYELGLTMSNIVIIGLLHDICKCNCYTKEYRNKKVYSDTGSKRDPDGRRFEWITVESYGFEDKFPCGHGGKSVIMLQNLIRLTQPEILLINWHMGPYSSANDYDFNNAVKFSPEIMAMYTADSESAALFEITVDAE